MPPRDRAALIDMSAYSSEVRAQRAAELVTIRLMPKRIGAYHARQIMASTDSMRTGISVASLLRAVKSVGKGTVHAVMVRAGIPKNAQIRHLTPDQRWYVVMWLAHLEKTGTTTF